jgi:hypothetical protein
MAITLRRLIDSGRVPRPRHSLLFMWVPEWYGTMAYIDAHPEMVGPALGGEYLMNINMDMVGEHLELLHSRFIMTRVPYSTPTAVNDVVLNMSRMVDRMDIRTTRGSLSRFNYELTPYSGGSDHMMFIDRRIPGVMFGHSPDYAHHTSDDTPDKVDPVELERSEIVAAAALLYLADLNGQQAVDLVHLVASAGAARLGASGRRASRLLTSSVGQDGSEADAWFEAVNIVRHVAQWERDALSSVFHYYDAESVRNAIDAAHDQIDAQERVLLKALEEQATSLGVPTGGSQRPTDDRVPVRTTRGPLDFGLPVSKLPPDAAAWYSTREFTLTGSERFELVNFIDGERTVTQIRDALSAEFWPIRLEVVARYLDDLERVGVLIWER